MASILDRLAAQKLLQKVVIPEHVSALLGAFQITTGPSTVGDVESGQAKLTVQKAFGAFNLDLQPPNGPRRFSISFKGPVGDRTSFTAAISLNEGPLSPVMKLVPDAVGRALTPAVAKSNGSEEWLERLPGGDVVLKGGDVWWVVQGQGGAVAESKLAPNANGTGVLKLQLEPPAVFLGSSEFGMEFSGGITLDFSTEDRDPGQTRNGVPEAAIATPADTPAWQGLVVRKAKFFLPKGVPFIGGHASLAHLQIGVSPPGIALAIQTRIAASGSRPAIDVRIECLDPTATGLSSVVPTLVEASMELPIDAPQSVSGSPLTFMKGTPVRARARFARAPGAGQYDYEFSLAVESQGDNGIASVDGSSVAGKAVVSAATLGTALMADLGPNKDLGHLLPFAAAGFSTFLQGGKFVVHSAEVDAVGRDVPKQFAFKIDYSVATQIQTLDVGVMSVSMTPAQPLRIRVRGLKLSFDTSKSGLDMLGLDYSPSTMEIEDPGKWTTPDGPNLFDILGTRSGRSSIWYEVDLGFKLDLGPVKVSGTTVRATVEKNTNKLSASFTGLAASIDLKPMITGDGALWLESPEKFQAALGVGIIPLNVSARGEVERKNAMVRVKVDVDFPGPLPLLNSGLAIYGLGGEFAANGRPDSVGSSPTDQLAWLKNRKYKDESGSYSFGLAAVIGTAPDLGFTFSSLAAVIVTTPTVAIRAALNASFMGTRKTM